MKKVVLSAPSVSIASAAENVTQNSFEINGNIIATGGSQVTDYGHCWNTTGNPTINDSKTDMGTTSAICSFKSTAANLAPYTKYYVKAYAKNAQGITYSDQVTIMTQDLASNKWDGKIATSFAGGKGTYIDPYIIETGGQLLLVKNYSDKYFKLAANIDLNNKNWLPFEFKGNLDGKGYTISNLYIDRTDDYQGLFSKCSGSVSELTIHNVMINGGDHSYIGTISGYGGTITNCKVRLTSQSSIIGDTSVGGISGGYATIKGCCVESDSNSAAISGVHQIGGLVGTGYYDITDCRVSCTVAGATCVGGIAGLIWDYYVTVENCAYEGEVVGEDRIGGIVGEAYSSTYKGCKSKATVKASKGHAGGMIGWPYNKPEIYSCYTSGTISAAVAAYGISRSARVTLSYSVMTCSLSDYYGIGRDVYAEDCATIANQDPNTTSGSNNKAKCLDITTFLSECYSDYADYWDFNNTWVWTGTVDGKTVEVSCPRLAWE
jgi:hypothetical protein